MNVNVKSEHKNKSYFTSKNKEKIDKYIKQLKPGEEVLMNVQFSLMPMMLIYIVAVIIALVIQRTLSNMSLSLVINIFGMVMAMQMARLILYVQSSMVLITTSRILGIIGDSPCNVDLLRVKSLRGSSVLLVDGGPYNFCKLQHMKDRTAVIDLLGQLICSEDGNICK